MLHYGNVCWYTFLYIFVEVFIWYFSNSWHNYFHKVLIMYRVMGEAGGKHVISAMQGNGAITNIQQSKMYVREVNTQYDEISDW